MIARAALSLFLLLSASVAVSQDTAIVVCPTALQPELASWQQYRETQGFRIHVIASAPSARELAQQIRDVASGLEPDATIHSVILIGDCLIDRPGLPVDPKIAIPTFHVAGPVTAAQGSTRTLATDCLFGDLDADGKPEIPVGRIPIDRPEQWKPFFDRVRAYEASHDFGRWRHTIDLTAGVGGFGPLIDTAIEAVTRTVVTSQVPQTHQTRITYASPASPFFPGFDHFQDSVVDKYNQGGLFWVYAGHGQVTALDRVPPTVAGKEILNLNTISKLRRPSASAPIALLLACYTGAFDARGDCLAERMLLEPGGPVVVVAGSRMTLPYGNAKLSTSMIDAWFQSAPDTLGELWHLTLPPLLSDQVEPSMIDTMAAMISPTAKQLPDERKEHARLYNLLGDPLMRLKHPSNLELSGPVSAEIGQSVAITGESQIAGRMTIEVHRSIEENVDPKLELTVSQRYAKSNDTLLEEIIREIPAGDFEVAVRIPESAQRVAAIIIRVEGEDGFALGHRRVVITTPKPASGASTTKNR